MSVPSRQAKHRDGQECLVFSVSSVYIVQRKCNEMQRNNKSNPLCMLPREDSFCRRCCPFSHKCPVPSHVVSRFVLRLFCLLLCPVCRLLPGHYYYTGCHRCPADKQTMLLDPSCVFTLLSPLGDTKSLRPRESASPRPTATSSRPACRGTRTRPCSPPSSPRCTRPPSASCSSRPG